MLSIIIPAYNVEEYLPGCLESILAADFTDYEILLIDDGSTDGTGALCEEAAQGRPFIKVFHTENRGLSAARNLGLRNAAGDYVFFVDADDSIRSGSLSAVMDILTADDTLQMACFNYSVLHSNGNEQPVRIWKGLEGHEVVTGSRIPYSILNGPGYVWNKIFRRDLIDGILFDESVRYGEDTLFVTEAVMRCEKAVITDTALYRYNIGRPGSTVGSRLDARSLEYLKANRRVFDSLRKTYPAIGMSRCFTAAKVVLNRMRPGEDNAGWYRELRSTLRFTPGEMLAYLKDKELRETKADRITNMLVKCFPRLIVLTNAIRKKAGKRIV